MKVRVIVHDVKKNVIQPIKCYSEKTAESVIKHEESKGNVILRVER